MHHKTSLKPSSPSQSEGRSDSEAQQQLRSNTERSASRQKRPIRTIATDQLIRITQSL